jgi:Icc-related predicted phosphoesterase
MKACMLGDLHGKKFNLPDADLYLGIGDLSNLGDSPEKKKKEFNSAITSDLAAMNEFFRSDDEKEFLNFVLETYEDMYSWLDSLGKPVRLISGNREIIITLIINEFQPELKTPYELAEKFNNIKYIDNQTVEFNGISIHGLPFIPSNEPYINRFGRVASFKKKFDSLKEPTIPGKPDVILSHSPPRDILDFSSVAGYVGSEKVLELMREKRPKYLFCGHLHEAKGMRKVGPTTVVNLGMTYELFEI